MEDKNTRQKNNPWIIAGSIVFAAVILAAAYIYSLGVENTNKEALKEDASASVGSIVNKRGLQQGNAPTKGDQNAPITIVEFGDFQCVACVQHFALMGKEVVKRYVETSKAKLVFKTLAFIDSYAQKTGKGESYMSALAGQCAADQGAFWQMYDAIYSAELNELQANKEQSNSGNLTREFFISVAQKNGLNVSEFSACVDNNYHKEIIDGYMSDAQKAMSSVATPAVFIIKDGVPRQISNPFDIEEYEKIINTQ